MSHMHDALELARAAAQEDEVPVGAVVVHQGQIIGKGYNRRETDHNPIAHAEMIALQEAARQIGSWRLLDCTLYVTLEPCPMCLAACQQARVSHVVYGAQDPKGGALSLKYPLHDDSRLNHRFTVEYEADAKCEMILKEFFKTKRKLIP